MKNIKFFKYKNTYEFKKFLDAYGYRLKDVEGFSVIGIKRYNGNILKVYSIWFKDCGEEYFKEVSFKSFNECKQSRLGFNGNKMLDLYQSANIVKYKVKDVWGTNDKYVIET